MSHVNHDEFVLENNGLKEYCEMKEEIKNFKTQTVHWRFIYEKMLSYCLKCKKNMESRNPRDVRRKNGRIILLSEYVVCDG